MANFTLQDIYDYVSTRVVDATSGTVTKATVLSSVHAALRRALRKFDLPNAENVSQLTLFSPVQQYAPPSGYKDKISLLSQYQFPDSNFFEVVPEQVFWEQTHGLKNYLSEARDGLNRYLLVSLAKGLTTNITVNNNVSFNGNGIWVANVATSDASNVRTDNNQQHVWDDQAGAVAFDILVAQSVNNYAEISNSTMNPIDLSAQQIDKLGSMVMRIWLPSASNYTSFTIRFGSSSANYYEQTVTTQSSGASFVSGFNTLVFDWQTATTVGTPVDSTITYALFRATYSAGQTNQTNLAINSMTMCEKIIKNLHSTSKFLVVDGSTSAQKEEFENVNDTSSYLNVDRFLVDWILNSILEEIFTNQYKDPDARNLYMTYRQEAEQDLIMRYPSKRQPEIQTYLSPDDVATVFKAW